MRASDAARLGGSEGAGALLDARLSVGALLDARLSVGALLEARLSVGARTVSSSSCHSSGSLESQSPKLDARDFDRARSDRVLYESNGSSNACEPKGSSSSNVCERARFPCEPPNTSACEPNTSSSYVCERARCACEPPNTPSSSLSSSEKGEWGKTLLRRRAQRSGSVGLNLGTVASQRPLSHPVPAEAQPKGNTTLTMAPPHPRKILASSRARHPASLSHCDTLIRSSSDPSFRSGTELLSMAYRHYHDLPTWHCRFGSY